MMNRMRRLLFSIVSTIHTENLGLAGIAGDSAAPDETRRILPKLVKAKAAPRIKTPGRLNNTLSASKSYG